MRSIHTVTAARPQFARGPMFWGALGALVAAQLVAFWLLCNHQVRIAEARHSGAFVQQLAQADCLGANAASPIAGCRQAGGTMAASASAPAGGVDTGAGAADGAMAVRVSYR